MGFGEGLEMDAADPPWRSTSAAGLELRGDSDDRSSLGDVIQEPVVLMLHTHGAISGKDVPLFVDPVTDAPIGVPIEFRALQENVWVRLACESRWEPGRYGVLRI